jgi:3-oxoacyl-[acyl-carrier-protein] synthase III
MGPETMKANKTAAIEDDTTASELMEEAANQWLERRKSKPKRVD